LSDVTLEEEFLAVRAVLEQAGVRNALCGGIAANLYRERIRATDDVDACIICSAPELLSLARRFEDLGWRAHPAWRKAELLRLERDGHPLVDLLIASTEFERAAVERAATFRIGDTDVRVLLPEDLIVFKLVAGRDHDYESVGAIIDAQGADLDIEYIQQTLDEFGMDQRWKRALEAAARIAEDLG
jgi:predicted nucleotidyltransferase